MTGKADAVADDRVPADVSGVGLERLFAALANQDRLALMEVLLRAAKDGPQQRTSISRLASEVEISRFSASRHLSMLRRAGLIEVAYDGRRALHHLSAAGLEAIEDWLYPFVVEAAQVPQDGPALSID